MRGKFEGCLLGLAIGDAMAAVGIGETRESIEKKFGQIKELVGGGKLNLEPGEYTDEGQMMVSVLESICTLRAFKPDNIAYRFVGWLKSHPKDIGKFTRHVLERMRDGERWQEASEGAAFDSTMKTAGSAGVICSVPVGLYRAYNATKLVEDTITCCRITHWDPRCTDSAVLANYTISLLVKGEANLLPKVQEFARGRHASVVEAVNKVSDLKIEDLDSSGFAPATLQAALWVLLNSQSFEGGMIRAANLGGESADAVAALAGAFLGTKYGFTNIPERWVYHLVGRDRIEVLASRLFEHSSAQAAS